MMFSPAHPHPHEARLSAAQNSAEPLISPLQQQALRTRGEEDGVKEHVCCAQYHNDIDAYFHPFHVPPE